MTSNDDLIHSLASAAGARRGASVRTAFTVAGAASFASALLLVFLVVGIRSDFADMAVHLPFGFKLAYTVSLAVGTFVVALYAATPGASARALYALSPAAVFLALGLLVDPTGFPIMGRTDTAVAFCVGSILFLSLPAMILMFVVMRQGAPTQPRFAGAVIGGLAAAVGAMAYMLACKNDGTAFVATWYTAACAIMAVVGSAVGHRVLRW